MGNCCGGAPKRKRPTNNELAERNKITVAEVEHFENLFKQFDINGDGKITAKELGVAMEKLGFKSSQDALKAMIQANDKDGSGTIEFPEFLNIVAKMKPPQDDTEKKAAEAFAVFDKDNDGTITIDELHDTLKMLNMEISDKELQRMVKDVDKDGDRLINKAEFVLMYKQISQM